MNLNRLRLWLQAMFVAAALAACGGGDPVVQADGAQPMASAGIAGGVKAPQPVSPVVVDLKSDPGDYVGQGKAYRYTKSDAVITAAYANGVLTVNVSGDEGWTGRFQVPRAPSQLRDGYYKNLGRYPFTSTAKGGMDWSGEGRGCNTLVGSFRVSNVAYAGSALQSFDLAFEQHCEGVLAALRGTVHWDARDTTTFGGPVNPPPADLWSPAPEVLPASGRYVYLKSDAGDYIGAGGEYLYTPSNSNLSISTEEGRVTIRVEGDEGWNGAFQAMAGLTQLQPGYYGSLQRYPFHNTTRGGLSWWGEGRGCNTLTGWFAVDEVSYVNGALATLKLRFEQHCEGSQAALRGQVNWTASDSTTPGGPVNPPPAELWRAPTGATPADGAYVYLQSDAGDYIGQGQTYLYTAANATLSASSNGAYFRLNVGGAHWWSGDFAAMTSLSQLQPGYYANLQRYPFHNPATGGLNWSGMGRGCNTLTGWFVVDSVSYINGAVAAIDLRFEQHCEGGGPALRGQIRWMP